MTILLRPTYLCEQHLIPVYMMMNDDFEKTLVLRFSSDDEEEGAEEEERRGREKKREEDEESIVSVGRKDKIWGDKFWSSITQTRRDGGRGLDRKMKMEDGEEEEENKVNGSVIDVDLSKDENEEEEWEMEDEEEIKREKKQFPRGRKRRKSHPGRLRRIQKMREREKKSLGLEENDNEEEEEEETNSAIVAVDEENDTHAVVTVDDCANIGTSVPKSEGEKDTSQKVQKSSSSTFFNHLLNDGFSELFDDDESDDDKPSSKSKNEKVGMEDTKDAYSEDGDSGDDDNNKKHGINNGKTRKKHPAQHDYSSDSSFDDDADDDMPKLSVMSATARKAAIGRLCPEGTSLHFLLEYLGATKHYILKPHQTEAVLKVAGLRRLGKILYRHSSRRDFEKALVDATTWNTPGLLLYDDMGLGKTLESIWGMLVARARARILEGRGRRRYLWHTMAKRTGDFSQGKTYYHPLFVPISSLPFFSFSYSSVYLLSLTFNNNCYPLISSHSSSLSTS